MRDVAELGVVRHPSGVFKMSRLWTEEEDSLLRAICASGEKVSSPIIAIRISTEFCIVPALTRAAVVGRARRLKLKLPIDRPRRLDARPTPQHTTTLYPERRSPSEPEMRREMKRGEILPETHEPGIYLLNASDVDCRRPINDPPAGQLHLLRVCGEPVARRPYGGVGYCEACCARLLTQQPHSPGRFVLPTKKRG